MDGPWRIELTSDITSQLSVLRKPEHRRTVDLKLNVAGKPLNVEIAGLYEIATPAIKEILRTKLDTVFDKAIAESSEVQKALAELPPSIYKVLKEQMDNAASLLAAGAASHLADKLPMSLIWMVIELRRATAQCPCSKGPIAKTSESPGNFATTHLQHSRPNVYGLRRMVQNLPFAERASASARRVLI